FLGVPDERAILLNRIAPVVPFVGAFIATLRWNYRRSMASWRWAGWRSTPSCCTLCSSSAWPTILARLVRSRSSWSSWSSPCRSSDPGSTAGGAGAARLGIPVPSAGGRRAESFGGRAARRVVQDRRGDVFLQDRADVAVRPEAPHRRLDRLGQDDEPAEGPRPEGQVMRLVQRHVLPEASEGLECLAPEEEAIPRVVRESPQGHRPLVAVGQGKQGTLGGVAESRHESGSAADHPGFLEGGDDGI